MDEAEQVSNVETYIQRIPQENCRATLDGWEGILVPVTVNEDPQRLLQDMRTSAFGVLCV